MKDIENKPLRTKQNEDFVDWLFATHEHNTAEIIGDPVDCPCIKSLCLERCTVEELKGYAKIASLFGQISKNNIDNECEIHTTPEERDEERNTFAFCLSTVEHAQVELARRELEFASEIVV